MNASPQISDAEWEVMRAVWANNPIAGSEVISALEGINRGWHPKTVRTLLARLVKKQAIAARQEGRGYVYTPLVKEQDCLANASESFLDRFFGGSLKPMLAHFVEHRKLSAREIAELRKILEGNESTKPSIK